MYGVVNLQECNRLIAQLPRWEDVARGYIPNVSDEDMYVIHM